MCLIYWSVLKQGPRPPLYRVCGVGFPPLKTLAATFQKPTPTRTLAAILRRRHFLPWHGRARLARACRAMWHDRATWHGYPVPIFCQLRFFGLLRRGTPVPSSMVTSCQNPRFWAIKPNNLHLGPKSPVFNYRRRRHTPKGDAPYGAMPRRALNDCELLLSPSNART